MGRARLLDVIRRAWCVPAAGALLACSAQVQSDYKGEPMATLQGTVVARSSALAPDVKAAIAWTMGDFRHTGEEIDVEGASLRSSPSICMRRRRPRRSSPRRATTASTRGARKKAGCGSYRSAMISLAIL